ncbi:MAG: DUF3305 domain-containing protein [Pseudomonadota bacterium]
MSADSDKMISMPVGVVVRKTPGATRWAKWGWKAVAVLPGAAPAHWLELRREGAAVEYHAGTQELELFRTDTEAYLNALSATVPSLYVVMRQNGADDVTLHKITASPFEAQDYTESGDEIVEKVPMPESLIGWIQAFVNKHHEDEAFVKRRRNKSRTDLVEDGKGDARIRQDADVYRSPTSRRTGRLQ